MTIYIERVPPKAEVTSSNLVGCTKFTIIYHIVRVHLPKSQIWVNIKCTLYAHENASKSSR